ncbi:MAG TPA: polysaccharide deacetylase family protein [Solirubrobacteraceae bacterium]|jgi:peptidoglycan/xylan/chitin deacetylase (PgdA/CDA1 family)
MRRPQTRRRPNPLDAVLAILLLLALVPLAGCGGSGRASTTSVAGKGAGAHRSVTGAHARERAIDAQGYAESSEVRGLVAEGKPIYCAGPRGDEVALTFDDGPGPYTRLVMAKLRKHGVKATFFVVGRNIPLIPGATHQERALGAVGDHTFTHPLLTALPVAEAEAEIVRTQALLERSSGGPVFLFRPPYGAHNSTIDSIAGAHGLLEILWTVDSADSLGANYAQIERTVIAGLHPGAIILMHENHGQTVRALLSIFAALERKHLRAVSVPQLLTDDPPSLAQVRAGGLGCGMGAGKALGGG